MNINKINKYGVSPFKVVLVHGGPGYGAYLKPVCEKIITKFKYGVLEPEQSKNTVDDQIEELKNQIESLIEVPITLVGHSWGAWLSFMFTAKYPDLVSNLVLVSCPAFLKLFDDNRFERRFRNLNSKEVEELKNSSSDERIEELVQKSEYYNPSKMLDKNEIGFNEDIFKPVNKQAYSLRDSEKMINSGTTIQCPIVVIHGDNDPRAPDGVILPLKGVVKKVDSYIIKNCGHFPWLEKEAESEFYDVLINVLN